MMMAACVLGITVLAAGCGQKDSGSDSGSASVGEQVNYQIIGIDPVQV